MIDPQVPVLTVAADGPRRPKPCGKCFPGWRSGVPTCSAWAPRPPCETADIGLTLPSGVGEELSPLLEIIPFQQLALHLAIARGGNPDAPRGLRKVTETV